MMSYKTELPCFLMPRPHFLHGEHKGEYFTGDGSRCGGNEGGFAFTVFCFSVHLSGGAEVRAVCGLNMRALRIQSTMSNVSRDDVAGTAVPPQTLSGAVPPLPVCGVRGQQRRRPKATATPQWRLYASDGSDARICVEAVRDLDCGLHSQTPQMHGTKPAHEAPERQHEAIHQAVPKNRRE